MMEYNKFINDEKWDEYNTSPDYLNKKYSQYKKLLKKHKIKVDTSRIEEYLGLFDENNSYRLPVLIRMIDVEFKNKRLKFKNNSKFNLFIDENESYMNVEDNNIINSISGAVDVLPGNVLYLSPKPIMDYNYNTYNMPYHYEELCSNMIETHIECDVDLDDIIDEINEIIDGEFGFDLDGSFNFFLK